jgi:hypothetical protein
MHTWISVINALWLEGDLQPSPEFSPIVYFEGCTSETQIVYSV